MRALHVASAGALLLVPVAAIAQSADEFYKGRQITMLVGSGAGGGYDIYARVWAKHASRHIPGQPQIVAKNMPAAAGIAAANTLYNTADRDGLTLAALPNGASMDPLAGNPQARFDALKMQWVGSLGKLQNVCATWRSVPR